MQHLTPTTTATILANAHIHQDLETVLMNDEAYLNGAGKNDALTADMLASMKCVLNALICASDPVVDRSVRDALRKAWSVVYREYNARRDG